jgi:APA family basic amino acid/polyamine antiporter
MLNFKHNHNPAASALEAAPRAVIGLREAIALIVGLVIGAGIFKAPSMVAGLTGDARWMFGAWALGGLMSVVGALCYAELSTAYSNVGGDYHFLHRAYGRSVSFLFAWARFSVIATGSIALLAFVFGDYMSQLLPLKLAGAAWGPACYAAVAIVVLSWANIRSIKTGTLAQTWLTAVEVGGLLLIVAAALFLVGNGGAGGAPAPPLAGSAPSLPASFGLAMVFVLLTYGGWNEAAYISAELVDVRRNMVRALLSAILLVTTLYLLVTWAYWRGLGLAGMSKSDAVAADLLHNAFGPIGATMISLIVAISAVTSINATIIAGARSSYAAGRDWPALAGLGVWDPVRETPANALRVQCAVALLLVLIGGWTGSGFKSMVEFTAPVFWFFFLLSGLALFVLRIREPDAARPFKVPLFPLLPLAFCAMCAYMLWTSLSYVYSQSLGGLNAAWIGVAVLAIGFVLLLVLSRRPRS